MRFLELTYNEKVYTNQLQIIEVLKENQLFWLIDSEVENAKIEIKNSTVIWHEGDYFSGVWQFGIFKNGRFFGEWINGIWENGIFSGKWQSGIKMQS